MAQLRFISTGGKWSFDFDIIALYLAAFNVSLLATVQLSTFAIAWSLNRIPTHLKHLRKLKFRCHQQKVGKCY